MVAEDIRLMEKDSLLLIATVVAIVSVLVLVPHGLVHTGQWGESQVRFLHLMDCITGEEP